MGLELVRVFFLEHALLSALGFKAGYIIQVTVIAVVGKALAAESRTLLGTPDQRSTHWPFEVGKISW